MHTTGSCPRLVVSADGRPVVSRAGSRLLADLAEATGLTHAFSSALRRLRPRGTGHDPGRIAVDLAVMLAYGGEAIADLALLRHQPEVFGPVASTPTAWRLPAGIDPAALGALRAARATARETAWLQAGEVRGGIPVGRFGTPADEPGPGALPYELLHRRSRLRHPYAPSPRPSGPLPFWLNAYGDTHGRAGRMIGMSTTTSRGALSLTATLLTASVALYMALVAFGNITDFGTNQQFVRHVLAMDTTFKDEDLMWRAITSKGLQDAAYVAIIVWETVAALVLVHGTWLWARRDHARARRMSTYGLLMVLLLFGAGFIAIGGEWFSMWQSEDWNGLDAATRVFLFGGVTLIVNHLPSGRTDPAT